MVRVFGAYVPLAPQDTEFRGNIGNPAVLYLRQARCNIEDSRFIENLPVLSNRTFVHVQMPMADRPRYQPRHARLAPLW